MSHDPYASEPNAIDRAPMILIPAGIFRMGSSDDDVAAILAQNPDWDARWFAREKPARVVMLPAYRIYRHPVTVAQYRAFVEATGAKMPEEPEWGWRDDHPIVNVSWDEAGAYAAWAGAALPTEAQWEKAARGEDGRWWPWGNIKDPGRSVNATNAQSTRPVGCCPDGASPYGVEDMAGNVWEWCHAAAPGVYDAAVPANPSRRPAPFPSTRVLRGGSWRSSYDAYLRCAFRCFDCEQHKGRGAYRRPTGGFRCVVNE